jgi:hypothetical protein
MARTWRWLLVVALPLVLAACTSAGSTSPGSGTGAGGRGTGSGPAAVAALRVIRHVWVIELENRGYTQTFGNPSADPYLARTLPRLGALLENYYAIGHSSAANYVVGPDRFIAWRSLAGASEPRAALAAAFSQILARPSDVLVTALLTRAPGK